MVPRSAVLVHHDLALLDPQPVLEPRPVDIGAERIKIKKERKRRSERRWLPVLRWSGEREWRDESGEEGCDQDEECGEQRKERKRRRRRTSECI
jgi:hypothetical protein